MQMGAQYEEEPLMQIGAQCEVELQELVNRARDERLGRTISDIA